MPFPPDSDSYSGFLLLIREVLGATVGSLGVVLLAVFGLCIWLVREVLGNYFGWVVLVAVRGDVLVSVGCCRGAAW